jgi:hypothetical protein
MTHLAALHWEHVMCLCSVSLLCTVTLCQLSIETPPCLLLMGMFDFHILWNSSVTFLIACLCSGVFQHDTCVVWVWVCIVLVHYIHYILYIFIALIIYYSHNVLG